MFLPTAALVLFPLQALGAPAHVEERALGSSAPPVVAFEVVTESGGLEAKPERVTRGRDAVSMVAPGAITEWLFERNPVDPRRVSAYRIDHEARRIVAYDESELRERHQIREFADLLTLRLDPAAVAQLVPTGEREEAAGVAFERRVRAPGRAGEILEVWWSETLRLPLRYAVERNGKVSTTRVVNLTLQVEGTPHAARLSDPRRRFPDYETVDVSDLGDRHP